MTWSVRFRRLPSNPDLPLPHRATPQAAGYDIRSCEDEVVLQPGEVRLVSTGLVMELPEGIECQVRPRSGLALKHGLTVLNAPGTIDADYRGEVGVILANLGSEPFTVTRGARIAQLVVAPYQRVAWQQTEELAESARGDGGFGSTDLTESAAEGT